MLAPTGPTPPVGGGDSEKAQLPLLNRVILNRYRTEKYFLPEESYFILGLMYFLRAPPKSVPVCPPHCKLSPLGDKSGCLVAATRVLHNPTEELEGGQTAAIDFTSRHRRHRRIA